MSLPLLKTVLKETEFEDIKDANLGKLVSYKILDDEKSKNDKKLNPNRQGYIRTIKNAHLVYKRQNDTNNYDELWVFKTCDRISDEMNIKKDILSGTDIPLTAETSVNNEQYYDQWYVGDVIFLKIYLGEQFVYT